MFLRADVSFDIGACDLQAAIGVDVKERLTGQALKLDACLLAGDDAHLDGLASVPRSHVNDSLRTVRPDEV